jgi:hypothetical protein
MKKIVRLTESDLTNLVKRIIKEQDENEEYLEKFKILIDNEQFETALQLGETLDLEDKVLDLILDKIVKEGDFKWWVKKVHSVMKEKKYWRIDSAIDDITYEFIEKDYYANILYNIINNMTDQNKTDEFYFKMIKLIYSEIEKQIKKYEKDSKIN